MVASRGSSSQVIKFSRKSGHFRVLVTSAIRDERFLEMPDATIHAVGKVLENLNPVLYRVALPNGKPVLAHLSKPLTEAKAVFSIDEGIVLE